MNNTQIKQKRFLHSLLVPKEIDVLISSTGGVGSSFLINHISNYKKTNDLNDKDKLKHLYFPPFSLNKNIKYIYVFGNPIDSVISLFARKYHHNHSKKIISFISSIKAVDESMTIEEYAAEGIDRFHFSEQFNNWLKLSRFYPTLFLKYEKLWENSETLYDFLEIPKEKLEMFPEKKKRSSEYSELDKKTQDELKKIYGDFEQYINDFDDCLIVNERKRALLPGMFFTKTFYYTARRSLSRKILDISPSLSDYLEEIFFSNRK